LSVSPFRCPKCGWPKQRLPKAKKRFGFPPIHLQISITSFDEFYPRGIDC
jgi:hypothetical protein